MTPVFSSILCAIDFSDTSREALVRAAAMARRFGARSRVLAVNDPLLVEAAAAAYNRDVLHRETGKALREFVTETLGEAAAASSELIVEVGAPAPTILNVAHRLEADLIVVGTHGLSGYRKVFFGSVTERLLRQTDLPVLVSPPAETAVTHAVPASGAVLAPVDLSEEPPENVRPATAMARALDTGLVLLHVVPRMRGLWFLHESLEAHHAQASARARERLDAIKASLADHPPAVEAIVSVGDPADEIAGLAKARAVQLVVMGLQSRQMFGPRPGSIAYRVLCLAAVPVLVLPAGEPHLSS